MTFQQFDVVMASLDPVMGREQSGMCPVLILQTNAARNASTFLVAPLSSQKIDRVYPYEVLVFPSSENGLSVLSKVKLDQIRVLDSSRFCQKKGNLEISYQESVLRGLDIIFDRAGDFR